MKQLILMISGILFLSLAQPGFGSENPIEDSELSTAEAFAFALENNPDWQKSMMQKQIAAAGKSGALGWESPEISFMREGVSSDLPAAGEERWTISQDLPSLVSGMKLRKSYDQAIEASTLGSEDARRRLRSMVKSAYAEVIHRERVVTLMEEQIRLADRAHAAVALREELGDASRRELLQSQLNNSAMHQDVIEAEKVFDQARYALFEVIGLPPRDQDYGVDFTTELVFTDVEFSQYDTLEELVFQPRFLAASAERKAAETKLAAEKWRLFPDLSISLYSQNYEGAGFDNHGFEVGARLPFWFMPAHKGRVGLAQAEAAMSRWKQESVLLEMKRELEQAWHGYESSLEVIRRLTDDSLDQSDELLNLTMEGYREGDVGLLDLLAAQQTHTKSQLRYQSALFDYYQRLIVLETFLPDELIMPVEQAMTGFETQGGAQ